MCGDRSVGLQKRQRTPRTTGSEWRPRDTSRRIGGLFGVKKDLLLSGVSRCEGHIRVGSAVIGVTGLSVPG